MIARGQENDNDSQKLRRLVVRGGAIMVVRHGLLKVIGLFGTILLARLLTPEDFGVFGIVNFIVVFLISMGELGLGASLIRQESVLDNKDLRVVFLFQFLLSSSVVLLIYFLSPFVINFFKLPPSHNSILRVLSVCLLITSFRTIPSITLEKQLDFNRLAIIDVLETTVYFSIAVLSAFAGSGVWSFVYAVLGRSLTGAIACNIISPWAIGFCWDWSRLRALLKFGIPYQGVSLISMVKDSIIPVIVGRLSGAVAVGYVNWAQTYAIYPLQFMSVINRVLFPAFSRLQSDPIGFGKALGRVIRINMVFNFSLTSIMILLSPEIISMIYTDKWLPAIPLVYLLIFANLFVPSVAPIMTALNALGASMTNFRFALLWFILTWSLGVPLILMWGFVGFGVANLLIQFSNLLVYRKMKHFVPLNLAPIFVAPFGALIGTLSLGLMVKNAYQITTGLDLLVVALIILVIYSTMTLVLSNKVIVKDIQDIWGSLATRG